MFENENFIRYAKIVLLSAILVFLSFVLKGNIDLNLSDEGYLWYGTIRTTFGEIPLADFQSYDPGRYYWGAAWFKILGNNDVLSLRVSCAFFNSWDWPLAY